MGGSELLFNQVHELKISMISLRKCACTSGFKDELQWCKAVELRRALSGNFSLWVVYDTAGSKARTIVVCVILASLARLNNCLGNREIADQSSLW